MPAEQVFSQLPPTERPPLRCPRCGDLLVESRCAACNLRRVRLVVEFDVEDGAPFVDTDTSLAKCIGQYLDADEINGLPFGVVPASFDVTVWPRVSKP